MTLLTVKNVSFRYDQKWILKHLDFEVQAGDYLCIIGENGVGKSTLIKGLLQLIRPSEGEIIFHPSLKKTEIGYLPQQTPVQKDFPASVEEVVLSGCLNQMLWRPFYQRKQKQLADEQMKRLGIEQLKHHSYRELSGGQQQRVLLARALYSTEKVLVLDEPIAGLDPKVSEELYGLLAQMNQEMGMTILMISHDVTHCLNDATHILHLQKNQYFYGTKEAYLNEQKKHHMRGGIGK